MNLMGKFKVLFQQFALITTGILMVITLEGVIRHLMGDDIQVSWLLLLSILVNGLLGALPTVLLLQRNDLPAKRYILRIVLHFILELAVVLGIGAVFGWYTSLPGGLLIAGLFLLVYAFVWLGSMWMLRDEDRKINRALKDIQDEE